MDRLITIRSAECTGCMQCVAECPAAGVAAIFLGVCACAQWTGHWRTDLPTSVYMDLVPRANEFTHP